MTTSFQNSEQIKCFLKKVKEKFPEVCETPYYENLYSVYHIFLVQTLRNGYHQWKEVKMKPFWKLVEDFCTLGERNTYRYK